MQHIDLFSGIGGFALAARWMGWDTIQFCEKEPFARQVLQKNFPGVPISTDIFNLNLHECTTPTILTGGFPCQPFSQAGERRGMADARAIWPEMLRVIHECKPTYIVAENVSGILTISEGLVFEGVCTDLESEGYEVQPVIIPASGVGAYHQRERIWFVAYSNGPSNNEYPFRERLQKQQPTTFANWPGLNTGASFASRVDWPSEPPVCSAIDGIPSGLVRDKSRSKQLKGYGNAIVPQVAYQIFQAIKSLSETPARLITGH